MASVQRIVTLLLTLIMALSFTSTMARENTWNEDRLNAYLAALAEGNKDPWQKAIYLAGTQNLSMENNVLTFFLRGFSPNLKSLPKRTEDPDGWLAGFFANVSEYSLKASLTMKEGEPVKNSVTKLKSTVKNAAAKAKEAFNQQTVKTALLDLLFPIPYKDTAAFMKGAVSPSFHQWMSRLGMEKGNEQAYSALLYAQTSRQISLNKGPHSLEYSVKSIAPDYVLAQCERAVMADVSKITLANAMSSGQLQHLFNQGLLKTAGTLRKSAKTKQVFTVDVDQLALGDVGDDYNAFLQSFSLANAFDRFETKVRNLPDYPAQDYPRNGRISGSTSGTKIVIKVPKDKHARYVQIRSAYNDRLLVDLFIRSGGSATVRAPSGMCYLLIAEGTTWYGPEALFGKDSILSKTEDLEITSSSRHYHMITLGGVTNGNLRSSGASQDMFKK